MYSITQYKHLIEGQDTDTRKRYALIEKLSEGFTKENATALELDRLLTEQLELEQADEPPAPSSGRKAPMPVSKKVKAKPAQDTNIDELFNELFEALKDPLTPFSTEDIAKAVQDSLAQAKITYHQLDTDLQQKLSVAPVLIQYALPGITTTAFKKPEILSFQYIVDDVLLGNNVLLIGGAGTGKTYLAEILLAKKALNRPHLTINCSQWTTPTEIIGGQTMDGYVEGKLIEAWVNGYILILDELPKIDPNTAGLFNDALAKTKILDAVIFNSRRESFNKHKDFGCIATGNIYPINESVTYGANNKQDLSLLDRFSGSVYFIEKNPVIEREVLQNDMIWSICDHLRSVIEELKYEAQLSLRFMQNARDAYLLERERLNSKAKNGIKASDGKTFKAAVDSYLSTFTDVQQGNLKERIRYSELFEGFEYRGFPVNKKIVF